MRNSSKYSVKTQFAAIGILVSLLFVLGGKSSAQQFTTIRPGVEYARVDHKIGNDPLKINLLLLDLQKVRIDVYHAFDKAIGVEPTSAIAKRHDAIAAINAGFFRLDKSEFLGEASGLLMIDKLLLSESLGERAALLIKNEKRRTSAHLARIETSESVHFADWNVVVTGVNRERKKNDVLRYTPHFGESTLTNPDGVEVIVRKNRIVEIRDGKGNSAIPKDGYVISAAGEMRERLKDAIKLDRKAKLIWSPVENSTDHNVSPSQLAAVRAFWNAEDAVAGVPMLITDGKVNISWEQEKASKSFVETRHPRTAVAITRDGKFLMMTVDGRQPGVSVGMNLRELADYLLSLGATDAMNLDGGGSTTMYLDGKVVNTPSDKEGERKVSDAIIVTSRKKRR